ncbi:DUF2834 domain-containing protein [Spirulina sp. 06S082]|uniref:DUF2834 domain-containing protein n=1 Tax=Spirulina sp. 06S082 TaxID=3110248 RepID=UPI002B1EA370|nr:DUF2834 domain-containing protein [Spirulina sp. 06S082]MEA5467458.1 DUF2834 domain-containing protein [Spirulina sp. 06S082]
MRKISFGLLWLGFIAYAFLFAPPDRPDTLDLIINLSTGNWQGINPIIVALFNIMGILPIAYTALILADGRGQKIRAYPFAIASFGLGAFALLPYFALRQTNPDFKGKKDFILKIFDSRWLGISLTLSASVLIAYAIVSGDWGDFIQQWQTSRFIHVMSLDFCLLSLLFPAILGDDMKKRGGKNSLIFWLISFVPLLGTLLYLSFRPPLPQEEETNKIVTGNPIAPES